MSAVKGFTELLEGLLGSVERLSGFSLLWSAIGNCKHGYHSDGAGERCHVTRRENKSSRLKLQ